MKKKYCDLRKNALGKRFPKPWLGKRKLIVRPRPYHRQAHRGQ